MNGTLPGDKHYLVRMLAAYMDVGASLVIEGSDTAVKADVKGLRLETLIELDKSHMASASSSSHPRQGMGHQQFDAMISTISFLYQHPTCSH